MADALGAIDDTLAGNVGGAVYGVAVVVVKPLKAVDKVADLAKDAKKAEKKPEKALNTDKPENDGFFEVLTESPISGTSRPAHRASANESLAKELRSDGNFAQGMNNLLGKDVLQHMQSGSGVLKNPPGTQWHHPKDNPNVMQLLRTEVHQNKSLQSYLHKDGTGGFADHF